MVILGTLILIIFLLALLAGFIKRLTGSKAGIVFALAPFVVFLQLLFLTPQVINGNPLGLSLPWAPQIGLAFSFVLDGLSLLMALLVSGIGTLVLIYGGSYLGEDQNKDKFFGFILLFMGAMLGLVFSNNAVLLFIFWELTSISSFFLIAYNYEKEDARAAAWQALLVTGGGGLALLAGVILLGKMLGTYEISLWLEQRDLVIHSSLYPVAFGLIFLGAAAKSAQFPLHFWLPNAMGAPTPVSTYLHSATMVKAGVFLLARLSPLLGGTVLWQTTLVGIGLLTLLTGVWQAMGHYDLKKILAYTTIGALGTMILLLGLGGSLAAKGMPVYLFAHGLYKGALFLVTGNVDHGAGSRDIRKLIGLRKSMPYTAAAGILAACSMAGFPPLLGFLAKEILYESALSFPAGWLIGLIVFANILMVAAAGWAGVKPFFGDRMTNENAVHAHEGGIALWFPPLILALSGLALGVFPALLNGLISVSGTAIYGQALKVKLSLWHGLTPAFGLSLITVFAGILLYLNYYRIQPAANRLQHSLQPISPAQIYEKTFSGFKKSASWLTRIIQNGYLRVYVLIIVLFVSGLSFAILLLRPVNLKLPALAPVRFFDVLLALVIVITAAFVMRARSRLAVIAFLGTIGYSIALIYLFYSAPDLAMVQFVIETLTVILFVLVLYRFPKFTRLKSPPARWLDRLVAIGGGLLMTVLILLTSSEPAVSELAEFYNQASWTQGKGRNIVNVILVDFRGLDTLGEITVLVMAALGVFSLLRLVIGKFKVSFSKGEEDNL